MNYAWSKQDKMTGVNSRFATISEMEILKIKEDAVPENKKKATKKCCWDHWVSIYWNNYYFQSQWIAAEYLPHYSAAWYVFCHYSPRFQRIIIVNNYYYFDRPWEVSHYKVYEHNP